VRSRLWGGVLAVVGGCSFDSSGLGSGSAGLAGASGGSTDANDGAAATTGAPHDGSTTTGPAHADTTDEGGSSSGGEIPTTGDGSTGAHGCSAPEWWDDAWSARRTLTIAGLELDAPLKDAVVMLRLDVDRIDYAHARSAGQDLRFVIAGESIAYEIERWNPRGPSWVWLRVPELADARGPATEVVMYYGNPDGTAVSDGAQTWAGEYVSVHHLEDLHDTTGHGHDAGSPAQPASSEGLVAGAQYFDGDDDHLVVAGEGAFDFTDALTVEALIRVEHFDIWWQAVVTKGEGAWRLHRDNANGFLGFATDTATSNDDDLAGSAIVDDSQWHYVAISYDGERKRIYVDGVQDADVAAPDPLSESDDEVMIGENASATGRYFDGRIDEVRISALARRPSYFAWHAHALADEVVSWGDQEICE
jgi:Concanavalin A-like lectin/glucanases superfamily/Domain of unknown function (DUF2341)